MSDSICKIPECTFTFDISYMSTFHCCGHLPSQRLVTEDLGYWVLTHRVSNYQNWVLPGSCGYQISWIFYGLDLLQYSIAEIMLWVKSTCNFTHIIATHVHITTLIHQRPVHFTLPHKHRHKHTLATTLPTGGNRAKLPSSRWRRRGLSLREVFACSRLFATTDLSHICNRVTRGHGTSCRRVPFLVFVQ